VFEAAVFVPHDPAYSQPAMPTCVAKDWDDAQHVNVWVVEGHQGGQRVISVLCSSEQSQDCERQGKTATIYSQVSDQLFQLGA
jgi:hypothetical protein